MNAARQQAVDVSSNTMTSIVILAISFLAACILRLTKPNSERLYKYVRLIHILFLGLTIVAITLLSKSCSFRGFLTDKIIVILFIATGMLLFGLYRKNKRTTKIYYFLYFILPFILLVGLSIPKFRFISKVVGLGLLIDGESFRYPIDNKYSIQTSRLGLLSGSPTYSLIENKYFLLEKVTDDIVPKIGTPKSLQVTKLNSDSFRLNVLTSEIYNERLDTTLSLRR